MFILSSSSSPPLPTRIVYIILHIDLVSTRWLYSALLTDLRRFACPFLCVFGSVEHLCACGYRSHVPTLLLSLLLLQTSRSINSIQCTISNIQTCATKQVKPRENLVESSQEAHGCAPCGGTPSWKALIAFEHVCLLPRIVLLMPAAGRPRRPSNPWWSAAHCVCHEPSVDRYVQAHQRQDNRRLFG